MAAATISMAIATTRFVVLPFRAHTDFTRNVAVSHWRASTACSSSISRAFTAFSVAKRNSAVFVRAAEVGNGEVATEEVTAPVAEELASGDEVRHGVEEVRQGSEEVSAADVRSHEQQQQGTKLYMGNLPWTCDSEQLAEILMEIGTVETVEVIYEPETGRSRGFAFVRMATNEDARAVISALDGSEMGGRVLKVDFPKPSSNNPRIFNPGRKRPGNVNKIFVGNLPWATDEVALIELFSGHGKVVEGKVVYDKETGRSRGFGFVVMDSAEEVETAINNLNETEFEGRLLRVDRVEQKPFPRQD